MKPSLLIVLLLGSVLAVQGGVVERIEQAQDDSTGDIDEDPSLYDGKNDDSLLDTDLYDLEETGNGDDYMYDPEADELNVAEMEEVQSAVESMLERFSGSCSRRGLSCSFCLEIKLGRRKRKICGSIKIVGRTLIVQLGSYRYTRRFGGKNSINIPIPKSVFGPLRFLVRSSTIKLSSILSNGKKVCVQLEIKTRFGTVRFPRRSYCFS